MHNTLSCITSMKRLRNLASSWLKEFRLISDIWTGVFPHPVSYRLSLLERSVMCVLVFVRSLSLSHFKGLALSKESRTQLSELYVTFWVVGLFLLLLFPFAALLYPILIAYRLIEGFSYRLCIIFVDRYSEDWSLRSLNRSLMLLVINYVEMIIGFAALFVYTSSIHADEYVLSSPWDALYFSIVTISTLGYGDFTPANGIGKFLVATETLMGIVFLILVVATFIGGIPRLQSEQKK